MKRSILFVVLLVAGCGSPKFDGSTPDKIQASIVKLEKGMTPEEKEQFAKDCMAAAIGNQPPLMWLAKGQMILSDLDGMTVEQIRARAATVRSRPATP